MAPEPRVLVVRPPEVPTYFNAGHHLPVFLVAAYLRRQPGLGPVDALDAAALNITWKELGDRLWAGDYDVIACMNDLGEVTALGEFVARARALCPRSRIVTFGRLSSSIAGHFERYDLDGIVAGGDYEAGVLAFVRWVVDPGQPRPGLAVRVAGAWLPPTGAGQLLPAGEWALPDIDEIPYEAHTRLYLRDENRFCGLPGRRELVVPVARGCPYRCEFCEVWGREGVAERRLPVARVVEYIRESFEAARFDYVAMYAPTFTLKRSWVLELCDALTPGVPWKCTTTLDRLDEALLERMAASGCERVSVGIETLEVTAQQGLPPAKRGSVEQFDTLADCCARLGIELNCFVILGLPGASLEGTLATAGHVRERGGRVRPTFYTPYHDMAPAMDEHEIASFNRQLAPGHLDAEEAAAYYRMLHAP
jgi:radical SAM superfamily enzyme YgiQ (UPF0313 family)